MKQANKITFIGAGNMATAIIGGLIAKGYPAEQLAACAPVAKELQKLDLQFGIATYSDNNSPIAQTDILVLCVKPQVMQAVCEGLKPAVQKHRPLIVSIAAGVQSAQLDSWLGNGLAIIRCMPNTPAQVHLGASGLFANRAVSENQKQATEGLFGAVGTVAWIEEERDLHTVTALSGSGPAYCFLFLEALEQAAVNLGLDQTAARQLTIQTMRGAAELATRSEEDPAALKRRVMSPGGTTEKAISRFEQEQLVAIVAAAVKDAWERSYQLAGEDPPE